MNPVQIATAWAMKHLRVTVGILVVLGVITFWLVDSTAVAMRQEHPQLDHALEGYACMMLDLAENDPKTRNIYISVRAQPNAASPEFAWVGGDGGKVLVGDPAHEVDGFIEIFSVTGQAKAWLASDRLVPYHSDGDPAAHCVPYAMTDGKYGFAILR